MAGATQRALVAWWRKGVGIFFVAFVIAMLLLAGRDCYWRVVAEVDSVDYFERPDLIPGVLEAELGCSPCVVDRIEFDDNDLRVLMERDDAPGKLRQYTIRKKTYVDRENVTWKNADPERGFDLREVDFAKLKEAFEEARGPTKRSAFATISIERFHGPEEPIYVGVSLKSHEVLAFDATTGKPYERLSKRRGAR